MDIYDMQDFSEVWSRVETGAKARPAPAAPECVPEAPPPAEMPQSGSPAPPPVSGDAEALCEFIRDELSDSRYYSAMAARCPQSGAVFRRLSAEEAEHAKRLRTAYFILTGECCGAEAECPYITSLCAALRGRYAEETQGAAAYLSAAGDTESEKLRELYSCLAADEKRHACEIEAIIARMMR